MTFILKRAPWTQIEGADMLTATWWALSFVTLHGISFSFAFKSSFWGFLQCSCLSSYCVSLDTELVYNRTSWVAQCKGVVSPDVTPFMSPLAVGDPVIEGSTAPQALCFSWQAKNQPGSWSWKPQASCFFHMGRSLLRETWQGSLTHSKSVTIDLSVCFNILH